MRSTYISGAMTSPVLSNKLLYFGAGLMLSSAGLQSQPLLPKLLKLRFLESYDGQTMHSEDRRNAVNVANQIDIQNAMG